MRHKRVLQVPFKIKPEDDEAIIVDIRPQSSVLNAMPMVSTCTVDPRFDRGNTFKMPIFQIVHTNEPEWAHVWYDPKNVPSTAYVPRPMAVRVGRIPLQPKKNWLEREADRLFGPKESKNESKQHSKSAICADVDTATEVRREQRRLHQEAEKSAYSHESL